MQKLERTTGETSITIREAEAARIETDFPLLTHMLEAFCCHGGFSMEIKAKGDVEVDPHHLVEDTGFLLGRFMKPAGPVQRAGCFTFPMDDALAQAAVDLSGRPYCLWSVNPVETTIAGTHTGLFREFFQGFARGAGAAVHLVLIHGTDPHHSIEAVFKAFARALAMALQPAKRTMSTKGVIEC